MAGNDKVFCSTCIGVDFEQLFLSERTAATGDGIITIGRPALNTDKSTCCLCSLFHQATPPYKKRYSLRVRLFNHIKPSPLFPPPLVPAPRQPFLSVLRKKSRPHYDYREENEIGLGGIIGYAQRKTTEHSGIQVVNAGVNYDAIRAQLDNCVKHHPLCECKQAAASELSSILLIDCTKGQVVRRTWGEQYLTLSYVWGNKDLEDERRASHEFSLNEAPLTIRDAAQVVRSLGRRYLWVDRACINQDDEMEKAKMLRDMDTIYERSFATIVTLYGDNDRSGLPGVSSIQRTPQSSVKTRSGCLIWSCPPVSQAISESTWNTRGWTYQEARLSRRCLFFSEHQVYCVCRQSTWSEALPFSPASSSITELLNSSQLDGALFGMDGQLLHGLFRDRLDYTRRNLKYREKDALNAFRGILRRSSFITVWGIPLRLQHSSMDPNIGFVLGQLWFRLPDWIINRQIRSRATISAKRCQGFPTWSWLSLDTEIYQDRHGLQKSLYGRYLREVAVDFPPNEAQTRFWLDIDGRETSLQDFINMNNAKDIPELTQRLIVEGDFVVLHYVGPPSGRYYYIVNDTRKFEPDIPTDNHIEPESSHENHISGEENVLVLLQWRESQRIDKRRFLLMVLKWIDEDHAERKGLLTHYRDEFSSEWIERQPRVRKKFTLQ